MVHYCVWNCSNHKTEWRGENNLGKLKGCFLNFFIFWNVFLWLHLCSHSHKSDSRRCELPEADGQLVLFCCKNIDNVRKSSIIFTNPSIFCCCWCYSLTTENRTLWWYSCLSPIQQYRVRSCSGIICTQLHLCHA